MALPKGAPCSQSRLKDILHYDQDTGNLIWKYRSEASPQWNGAWPGKIAGSLGTDGYLSVGVLAGRSKSHRVVWLWVTGDWPELQIDHIDGDKTNNRFANLRLATQRQNNRNNPAPCNNTSGYKGVCFAKDTGRWQVQIRIGGERLYLGQFDTAEMAHQVYCDAAKKYHGDFARVR